MKNYPRLYNQLNPCSRALQSVKTLRTRRTRTCGQHWARRQWTHWALKTTFHLERLLDLSKLKISVNLYVSPSHLQSLGAAWGGIKSKTTNAVLKGPNGSFFSFRTGPFSERVLFPFSKKIHRCWKSAASMLKSTGNPLYVAGFQRIPAGIYSIK